MSAQLRHEAELEEASPPVVLSAVPGELFARDDERDLVCLLDDGTLHVSEAHRSDPFVLAYQERLKGHGRVYTITYSTPERIQSLYRDGGPALTPANATQVQEEVVALLREATKMGASDVHIVTGARESVIRVRVHGVLEDYKRLREAEGHAIASTIYSSMLDTGGADTFFKRNQPQDGRLKENFVSSINLYGARVATRPTDRGHLMVMRLLYNTLSKVGLADLGYLPEQIEIIQALCHNKTGINILSGATGSGKSLSLKCALELLIGIFDRAIHVLTIEDPPEYTISGAVQTPVLHGDWAGAIANAMRLDPDVLQIGELRDHESAMAGFRAAMTGHGVWTTLHANDVVSSLERLKDLGVEEGLLTDPMLVTSLINQSLVRRLCPECSRPYREAADSLSHHERDRVEAHCDVELVRIVGTGCNRCRRGFVGRTLVAEVVRPNAQFMEIFRREGKLEARRHWVNQMRGVTKTAHAIRRINQGLVDPLTVERDIGQTLDREGLAL